MPAADLALDHSRILLSGELLIYLERTLAGEELVSNDAPPRAYGLAPTVLLDGEEVVGGIAPGERIWLGFQAVDPRRPVSLRVRAEGQPPRDDRLTCPPGYYLPEHPGGGCHLFSQGRLTVIVERPSPAQARIRIVDLDTFSKLSGKAAQPLDPDAGYGGWLLP
jgi:hypothetical protein